MLLVRRPVEDGTRKISGGIMFGVLDIIVLLMISSISTIKVAAGRRASS
ncbi:MAG: hypothetical protein IKH39_06660 [Candidatus Methanomethylophilaceae archaeon]|nr:hypothetical protein [Candidatus Methanomethylophilaceae archaeon]